MDWRIVTVIALLVPGFTLESLELLRMILSLARFAD